MTQAAEQISVSFLHGYAIDFGKHKGTRIVRVPVGYLWWLSEQQPKDARITKAIAIAKAELDRRGAVRPTFDIPGHAIDRASLQALDIYRATRNEGEGLHAWLCRQGAEAMALEPDHKGRTTHLGIVWCWDRSLASWPILMTVHRAKETL